MDKPIFNGLMHSGLPDLWSLYRVPKIILYNWKSFPGWTDETGLPTSQYYDAFAAGVVAPRKIVMLDHEKWKYATQEDRIATANKYVTIYQEIKQRRPDLRIGWYCDPIRRDWWRAIKLPGSIEYSSWQADNNDLAAIMAPCTDVYMPSLYVFYTRDTSPQTTMSCVSTYLRENISEVKRVRRVYGFPDCPIYPYVWWRRADDTRDLDLDVYETVVRTVMDEADGMVLWGGWKPAGQIPPGPLPWDENAPWWVTIKARLTDKRRTE